MHRRSTLLLSISLVSLLSGCLDATPVSLQTQDAGLVIEGGGIVEGDDGSTDGPMSEDAYPHPECRACIAADPIPGPGCGDKLANCGTTPHCLDIYECAYKRGCVTKPSQNESISCALPCA